MPKVGDIYFCEACESLVRIEKGGEGIPWCCEQPMIELATERPRQKGVNSCGVVLRCRVCGAEVRVLIDGGGLIYCSMEQMDYVGDPYHVDEKGQIFRCPKCGQVIRIIEEGCDTMSCCHSGKHCSLTKLIEGEERQKVSMDEYDKTKHIYDDVKLKCGDCGRVVRVIKVGKGKMNCHGKPMTPTERIGYYFQGGG